MFFHFNCSIRLILSKITLLILPISFLVRLISLVVTAQKMKFSIKDFFSKWDQIRRKHFLNKSLMENIIFCAVCWANLETLFMIFECEKKKKLLSSLTFSRFKTSLFIRIYFPFLFILSLILVFAFL